MNRNDPEPGQRYRYLFLPIDDFGSNEAPTPFRTPIFIVPANHAWGRYGACDAESARGLVVMISVSQTGDPGSIPGGRTWGDQTRDVKVSKNGFLA